MEHELYLKILQDFPALIWRSGTDGMCDYFNTAWLEFTGKTLEQEKGNGWAEGVHPEDFDACLATYLDNFGRRSPFNMEYRLKNRKGEYRWILDMGRPFYGLDDSFLGYIGSCYDITPQKEQTRQLLELGDFRDRIFSIIGHDLRNMMGTIRSFGALMHEEIEEKNTANCHEYSGLITATAGNCLHLLTNLLDWGSSRSGSRLMEPEVLDPYQQAKETIDLFATACKVKGITLTRSAQTTGPLLIFADPDYLKAIYRNLLSNAIKFTPRGGSIDLSCSVVPQGTGKCVRIKVRDSGTGMDDDVLARIRTGINVNSRRGTEGEGGSGLGLSLCASFLKTLGGTMTVDSAPGKGSTFTLEFPAVVGSHQT